MTPSPYANAGLSIIEVMEDESLFGGLFHPAEDWVVWKVALKALFGLPMEPGEVEIFRECTGLEVPPTEPSPEAFWIIGRRGG